MKLMEEGVVDKFPYKDKGSLVNVSVSVDTFSKMGVQPIIATSGFRMWIKNILKNNTSLGFSDTPEDFNNILQYFVFKMCLDLVVQGKK